MVDCGRTTKKTVAEYHNENGRTSCNTTGGIHGKTKFGGQTDSVKPTPVPARPFGHANCTLIGCVRIFKTCRTFPETTYSIGHGYAIIGVAVFVRTPDVCPSFPPVPVRRPGTRRNTAFTVFRDDRARRQLHENILTRNYVDTAAVGRSAFCFAGEAINDGERVTFTGEIVSRACYSASVRFRTFVDAMFRNKRVRTRARNEICFRCIFIFHVFRSNGFAFRYVYALCTYIYIFPCRITRTTIVHSAASRRAKIRFSSKKLQL